MEPIENIRLVCANELKPNPKFIEFQNNYFLDKHVKIKFTDRDNKVEHCWLFVIEANDEHFTGTMANDPILNIGYMLGDQVKFTKFDIEDVYG